MSRADFACFAKVQLLFKANSPVQHKQGLLKTFSCQTIAMTFDVFMVLTLPYCLIVMFYNIFSPSSQALFQVPLFWNSWLHHPSFCIQWDTMERISQHLFWLKLLPPSPVYTASFPSAEFTDVPAARLKAQLQRIISFLSRKPLQSSPVGHFFLGTQWEAAEHFIIITINEPSRIWRRPQCAGYCTQRNNPCS